MASGSTTIPVPIAQYKFDQTTRDQSTGTTTTPDSIRSGAAGDARVIGTPSFTSGQVGNAMCLGTTGDFAIAPLAGAGLQEFTVSSWVKMNNPTKFGTIVKNWGQSVGGSLHLGLDSTSTYWENFATTSTGSSAVTDSNPAQSGTWQFLVSTVSASAGSGGEMKLYVDGTEVASSSFSGSLVSFNGSPTPVSPPVMSFGQKLADNQISVSTPPIATQNWFDGCIDETTFWDVALSPAQISAIISSGGGVSTPGDNQQNSETSDSRSSASKEVPLVPGAFLTITGRPGDEVHLLDVIFGGVSLAPGATYAVTIRSAGATVSSVLASGRADSGGHLERELALPALTPGRHLVVFSTQGAGGKVLVLGNIVEVSPSGSLRSKTAESLQPDTR